ncbi:MAG: hypothetical protein U0452_16025 [Anaerolineae bacterium]
MSHPWMLRLVLGALWFIGIELLPWAAPAVRAPWEWPLLVAGYIALAAILLDTAARYRLRDGYGLMALAGLAGLTAALLFNPDYALANPPMTWFTRAMGALTLGALVGLLVFLRLARPIRRRWAVLILLLAAPAGALWGFWARWSPLALDAAASPTTREPLTLTLIVSGALVIGTLALAARTHDEAHRDLRLPLPILAVLLLTLLGVLVVRVLNESVDTFSVVALPILGLICLGILYYQKRIKGPTLLDPLPDLPPRRWFLLTIPVVLLAAGGAIAGAHAMRGAPDSDGIALLSAAITAFGFLWLPGMALAIAARAFSRLARTERL